MSGWRKLRQEEIGLIAAMVRTNPDADEILRSLPTLLVEDMKDGGMGSLRFKGQADQARRFGKKIAEAEYVDEDGVPVSAVINLDNYGQLFELDIWKADFSPLKRYPLSAQLNLKPASPQPPS